MSDETIVHVQLVDSESHGASRTCFLLLFLFSTAVPLNIFLVIAILRSFLRSHIYNILLLALSCSAVLDAAVNLPLACLFRGTWTYLFQRFGNNLVWICRFNSASSQLPMMAEVSCLVLLSAQRLSELNVGQKTVPSPVKGSGIKRYAWLLLLVAVISVSTVTPFLLGAVQVRFFHERYSCSPINVTSTASSLAAAVSLLIFGHAVPYFLLVGIWIVFIVRVLRERRRLLALQMVAIHRAAARSSPLRGLGSSFNITTSLWDHCWSCGDSAAGQGGRFFLLTAVLVVLHCFLLLPHLLYIVITQFSILPQLHIYHPLFVNSSLSALPPQFKPIHTQWLDGTCTWLRILHSLILPIVILAIHQSLRTQVCEIFRICRHNRYSQLSPISSVSDYLTIRRNKHPRRKRSKFQQLFYEDTPVLFATCDGLYLRQTNSTHFADVGTRQAGENIKRVVYSPMLQSSLKQDVRLIDEEEIISKTKKGAKSVRFSQKVNEIPRRDSNRSDCDRECLSLTVFGETEVRSREQRSLEMELANNSILSTTSGSSLLLQISQRLRRQL